MAPAAGETDARFEAVVTALARRPGVTHSAAASRRFGSTALKVHDKIFAMVSSNGHFVVKLPKARVDALVGEGAGQRFDANRGRPMSEWLEVNSESGDAWLELAREALEFVGT
jgi:TfoX/Sxy family transcriptional regulator of competence genes